MVGLEPLALAHRLSRSVAYSHVARLAAAGWVERIPDRHGTLVAITGAGRREVRADLIDRRAARPSLRSGVLVGHAIATSWIAARMTLRGFDWLSDREMRTAPEWQIPVISSRRARHRPDLGATSDGTRVAWEVELTAKSASRWRAILRGYAEQIAVGHLHGVIYAVDHPGVRAALERNVRQVGLNERTFLISDLEELRARVRASGKEAS